MHDERKNQSVIAVGCVIAAIIVGVLAMGLAVTGWRELHEQREMITAKKARLVQAAIAQKKKSEGTRSDRPTP